MAHPRPGRRRCCCCSMSSRFLGTFIGSMLSCGLSQILAAGFGTIFPPRTLYRLSRIAALAQSSNQLPRPDAASSSSGLCKKTQVTATKSRNHTSTYHVCPGFIGRDKAPARLGEHHRITPPPPTCFPTEAQNRGLICFFSTRKHKEHTRGGPISADYTGSRACRPSAVQTVRL